MTIWLLVVIAFFVLLARMAMAVVPPFTSLKLAWDKAPSHGTNIGYVLKWGSLPGATNFSLFVGTNLTAVVTNPTSGYLYFNVVARTSDGVESDPSNILKETNNPAAPLQLRITTNTTTGLKLEGSVDLQTWIHLADIVNDPATVAMRQRMMLRASTNRPPLPGGAP